MAEYFLSYFYSLITKALYLPDPQPYNEQELLKQLAGGDEWAMRAIYHAHFKKLYLSAYSRLKDVQLCEDIVLEVFFSLWQKREVLEIATSLAAYLAAAVRYKVLSAIRDEKVRTVPLFDRLEERIWREPSPEELLSRKELQVRINNIVDLMPAKMQQVYLLSRQEQLSHKEIAERLGISVKTVEMQVRNALIRIRQSLGDMMPVVIFFLCSKK